VAERPVYVPPKWYPACAQRHAYDAEPFPPAGAVVAYDRGVWRVTASRYLTEVEWNDGDRERYAALGQRDRKNWRWAPYRVEVEFAGGVLPDAFKRHAEDDGMGGVLDVHAGSNTEWWVYPHGRWPQCSCCGEPMPCRAELQDLKVDAAMQKMETMGAKMPGCCWGCGEPVTRRHKTVRYAGENLDLPGGPGVVFHIRQSCHYLAVKYETRWLAADTSRRRILTWPKCRGALHWYPDGSNTCKDGEPDCQGWVTHNHGSQYWLYGAHSRMPRRPDYRDPDLPQGRPDGEPRGLIRLDDGDAEDGRPDCPGSLVTHEDGTQECVRGGRDDCWDGSKYRHAETRACSSFTHGCPKCETTEGLA